MNKTLWPYMYIYFLCITTDYQKHKSTSTFENPCTHMHNSLTMNIQLLPSKCSGFKYQPGDWAFLQLLLLTIRKIEASEFLNSI